MDGDFFSKSVAGFSLLEALVALAVAGILAVVGIPGLTTVYLDNRRATTVNEFLSALQIARSEAIKRNQRVVFCASTDRSACGGAWTDGAIVFADRDNDGIRDGGEPILLFASVGRGLSITSSEFPDQLIYRPNGRVMGDNIAENQGDLEVCDDRGATAARVVSIEASGRPRVDVVNAAGETPAC